MDKSVLNKILAEEADLLKQQAKIVEDLNLLQAFKRRFFADQAVSEKPEKKTDMVDVSLLIPLKRKYNRGDQPTIEDKVMQSLAAIGKGMLQDVANKYFELFPETGKEKSYTDAKYQLSKLYRDKKIKGTKVAGKKGYMFTLWQRPAVRQTAQVEQKHVELAEGELSLL